MEKMENTGPWIWAYSQKHKARYWYNMETKTSTWINPYFLLASKKRANGTDGIHPDGKKYRSGGYYEAIEDHPSLSIERDRLLGEILDLLAKENTRYGEMAGETKTAKSCRKDGMKVGMQGTMITDSIFPNVFEGDPAVLKEFIDGGRTEEESRSIMRKVGDALVQAARKLLDMKRSFWSRLVVAKVTLRQPPATQQTSQVQSFHHSQSVAQGICRLDYQGVTYSISSIHLNKLLRLYQLHTDSHAHIEDSLFLRRVFCVLARYETLSGKSDGYQMAFPDIGFQFLRDRFDVQTECFASPLNCWNSSFCSIARDTDQFFGSLGNFFCFEGERKGRLVGGSFEANPPFVEAVMNQMADRIFYLLRSHPDIPFSFIVIVPAWADCQGVIEMTDSEFTRPHRGYRLVLEKKKHDYRPGMQHRTGHTHQPSNVDTFVFFLQNDAGAACWPVELKDALELENLLEEDCRVGQK